MPKVIMVRGFARIEGDRFKVYKKGDEVEVLQSEIPSMMKRGLIRMHNDTQANDTQANDTQANDTQANDTTTATPARRGRPKGK